MSYQSPITVSRRAARRFLVESLLLMPETLSRALEITLDCLEAVQIDPVARVARNQDLALWARHPDYRPEMLERLLSEHTVFEYLANQASVLPMWDYPVLEGVRRRWQRRLQPELDRFALVVRTILERIETQGAMPARAFDSKVKVRGYWDTTSAATKETSHVLNLMCDAGLVMVAERKAGMRYFDIPERIVPPVLREQARQISTQEADEQLFDKYLRAYHLVNSGDPRLGWIGQSAPIRQRLLSERSKDGRLQAVRIENVKTLYYVLENERERLEFWQENATRWESMVRFLPPLDNLLWDRRRVEDVFDFVYRWELYVPVGERQFGVYAMPILCGDRLIGRIDPQFKRQDEKLIIHNLTWEPRVKLTRAITQRVYQSVEKWAERLGARSVEWSSIPSAMKNGY